MVQGRVAVAAGGFLVATLAVPHLADACVNAVLSTSDAYQKLMEAEEALDEGDVANARELAAEVAESEAPLAVGPPVGRADAVVALSFVRDRKAGPQEIGSAIETLRARADWRNQSPEVLADLGEAQERAGNDAEALAILEPLAERDLLGSSWAYAALGRAAHRRGEEDRAQGAFAHCRTIASVPSTCDGVPAKPSLLRWRNVGYGLPWLILTAASVRRHLGGRRGRLPWKRHRAWAFHGVAFALAALACLVGGRHPWAAAALAATSAFGLATLQQRLFVGAVATGKIRGLGLRSPDPEDARLRRVAFFFGPSPAQTLEWEPDAGYREVARVPLLRLDRRRPTRALVVAITATALVASVFVFGFFAFSRSRAAGASEVGPTELNGVTGVLSPLPSASPTGAAAP
jgi:hypothetical protein